MNSAKGDTYPGSGIGLATCYVVSAYGYHLDPKVYLIDRLPKCVAHSSSAEFRRNDEYLIIWSKHLGS